MAKHVRDLVDSVNLAKLIVAKRSLDKAVDNFDEVWEEEGAPCEVESEQEVLYDAVATIEKRIERLMGAVVFHELFGTENNDKNE